MGRKRVHESAGDATQRKRAVQREKRARRAEQSAQRRIRKRVTKREISQKDRVKHYSVSW